MLISLRSCTKNLFKANGFLSSFRFCPLLKVGFPSDIALSRGLCRFIKFLSLPSRVREAATCFLLIVSGDSLAPIVTGQSSFVNFEGAQTSPVRLSPDGTRLFAVNTPGARLSVFDLTQPSAPALVAEIPVGLEPVSINPRTNDEAWVVNQVSDSISIVSISRGIVTHTIYVKDEPADVVFAGNPQLAFVTVARSNEIRVFDGQSSDIFDFLSRPVFDRFENDLVRQTNLNAFLLCFDTGTAPAVGYTRTLTSVNVNDSEVSGDWTLLENQAALGNIDLVAKGTIDGERRGLLYRPATNDYLTDKTGVGPFALAQLRDKIIGGDTLSVMGVPVGSDRRTGIDRNLDSTLDSDPPAPPAAPVNLVATTALSSQINLRWTDTSGTESMFSIERCRGSAKCSNFTQVATVGPDIATYADKGLTRLTIYRYRVRAHNAVGSSAYSNTAQAKTAK